MSIESYLTEANKLSPSRFRRSYVAKTAHYERIGYTVKKDILSFIILAYVICRVITIHLCRELASCVTQVIRNSVILVVCTFAILLLPVTVLFTFLWIIKNARFV